MGEDDKVIAVTTVKKTPEEPAETVPEADPEAPEENAELTGTETEQTPAEEPSAEE